MKHVDIFSFVSFFGHVYIKLVDKFHRLYISTRNSDLLGDQSQAKHDECFNTYLERSNETERTSFSKLEFSNNKKRGQFGEKYIRHCDNREIFLILKIQQYIL